MAAATRSLDSSARRQALLRRSAELRNHLTTDAAALLPVLRVADRAHAGWRWVAAHPAVVMAGMSVFVVLRPRRAWTWGWRLVSLWRLSERARSAWAGLNARRA